MKFLIVSFDGLRPDLVSPALTPNIDRLQRVGMTLGKHRTVYPSETRVAFPSLVTGVSPRGHGMVGNKFVDRTSSPHRYLDTSDALLLRNLNRESGGRLMTAETLGETLHAAAKTFAVLSTNTPGTTTLFSHKAGELRQIRLSGHFREACSLPDALPPIEAAIGPLPDAPPRGEPDTAGQEWITSAFLNFVWPRHRPDVTILSFGEPDTTSHFHGTGSETTLETIAFCDAQFGRVMDWWEAEGRAADVQIIAVSDHGHITAHTRISVASALQDAGFSVGNAPATGINITVVPGQVGAVYLADRSPGNLVRVVDALIDQPWCGPIFTRAKNEVEGLAPGTLSSALVFADHERAPDIYFAYRSDDTVDQFGLIGGTYYDGDRVPGLGVHGGLHVAELSALGIVAGSLFRADGGVSLIPTDICDFAPTILHGLGLLAPATMKGRILREVFAGGSKEERVPAVQTEQFEIGLRSFTQSLRRAIVGERIYLDRGAASSGGGSLSNSQLSAPDMRPGISGPFVESFPALAGP